MTTTAAATARPTLGESRAYQRCINPACGARFGVREVLVACPRCGSLLDVAYDWSGFRHRDWSYFELRSGTRGPRGPAGADHATASTLDFSGVWRFRDLLPFYDDEASIVSVGEGRTNLQRADGLARGVGMDVQGGGRVYLQYEGFNPSGSFKDNGMAAAFTHARMVGARRVACASTGNTSASLAMYAAILGLPCFVFIGDGKIAYGKLSQALEYGARTLQIAGDFDACLARVRQIAETRPEVGLYLMNSVNPFRLEGQKTIMYRVLEGLDWESPDWIVVPGGNLGNTAAFGKAFMELVDLGLVKKVPRIAVINARGARTLDRVYNDLGVRWGAPVASGWYERAKVEAEYARMDAANERARTVATAIEINRPVNMPKALRTLAFMDGVVRSADDAAMVEHKAMVGRFGFGCEPSSGATVAGVRLLRSEGVIKPHERVVCVLTGHLLKDPDVTVGYHTGIEMKQATTAAIGTPTGRWSNPPIKVADDLEAIIGALES
ncbi:MAG: threonine synthase [Phycisphaerae bacterium]|nr:threonine synthase [Phycisphaerae bacterium]